MTEPAVLLVVQALAAVAATALAMSLAARWGEHRDRVRLLKRLGSAASASAASTDVRADILRDGARSAGRWWRVLRHAPFFQDGGQLLEQAGLRWGTARLVQLTLACGGAGAALGLTAVGTAPGTLIGLAAGSLAPSLYVRRRRAKRLRVLEEQLPDAIDLLGRAIRAGHALTTAVRLVAEETAEPLASEFRRVFEEQKYGMRFEESLLGLTRRVDLIDLRVMVVAILVQREIGGNLAEILDKIAQLIRTRFSLRRQVQVYTAQGRMSGSVLGLLPIALAGVIYLVNPEYIKLLFTEPAGRIMVGAAIGSQLVGYIWISRILKLDL